jgi:hypothetical protein
MLKLPKRWIVGAHHVADGKSPCTASEENTAEAVGAAAKTCCTILHSNLTQILRTPGLGRAEKNPSNSKIPEFQEAARMTAELHGAAPPKGIHASFKICTRSTTTSQAPPAGDLPIPTLYTRRETGFSHPPAAGAADGEGGTHASTAARWNRRSTLKNRLL